MAKVISVFLFKSDYEEQFQQRGACAFAHSNARVWSFKCGQYDFRAPVLQQAKTRALFFTQNDESGSGLLNSRKLPRRPSELLHAINNEAAASVLSPDASQHLDLFTFSNQRICACFAGLL